MKDETKHLFETALQMAEEEGITIFGFIAVTAENKLTAFCSKNMPLLDILVDSQTAINLLASNGPAKQKKQKVFHA